MSASVTTLLLESAWHASVIPFGEDTTFFAMVAFGQDVQFPFVLSVIGALIGQSANWVAGRLLMYYNVSGHILPTKFIKPIAWFRLYGHYLLVLSWVPLLNLLTVAAGMAHIPLKRALPPLLLGTLFYYGYQLF